MEEKKFNLKEFCIKNRGKIMIGVGLICGAALGYFYGIDHNIWKRLDDGDWNFDILNNTELKVSRHDPKTKKIRWYKFDGKQTKEIVDRLMDKLYPGD